MGGRINFQRGNTGTMTDPEETNEELSTDELKSVSGGISAKDLAGNSFTS